MQHLDIYDFIFIATLVLCFFIRFPYEKKNLKLKKVKSDVTLKERINLLCVFTGSLTMPLLYIFTPWFNFSNYPVHLYQGIMGSLLAIAGLWLFWRSHKDLDIQFSPMLELKENHKLITHGVYKNIRHPMYTAVFMLSLSQLALIGNWVVGPAYFLTFFFLYVLRVRHEEALMLEHYGDEYSAYMKRTGRLFPRLS